MIRTPLLKLYRECANLCFTINDKSPSHDLTNPPFQPYVGNHTIEERQEGKRSRIKQNNKRIYSCAKNEPISRARSELPSLRKELYNNTRDVNKIIVQQAGSFAGSGQAKILRDVARAAVRIQVSRIMSVDH